MLQLDQLDPRGRRLSVLPALVYGSPPVARIDGGKLVHLRGPVPLRDPPAERRAVERLRAELDLLPGRRTNYAGADAPRFVEKLKRWRGDLSGDAAGVVKPAADAGAAPAAGHRRRRRGRHGVGAVRAERLRRRKSARPSASVDATAVVRAWQEGLGIVPLSGGGWASLPARLAAEARPARGRSAGRARGRRPSGAPRAAGAGGALRRARSSAAARASIGWRRWSPGSSACPRRRCRGDLTATLRAVPAAGGRAGSRSCAAPASAASSPTTWASARRCRRCARSTPGRAARWSSARPA